ncbi:MAG: hypothetical protein K8T20_15385 [Planctomycetes bacterium]|nr:hypothetical protein [Planctomycetota bacterium]
MRRIPGLVVAVFLAAATFASADVSLEGGFCLPPRVGEAWVEVWAEIENGGTAEFNGTLEAELPGWRATGPKAAREVAIAPGAKKRFFLVLSNGFGSSSSLQLRVRERGKGEAASKKITAPWPPGPDRTLVVIARPESPAALIASLPERKLAGAYYRCEVEAARLPEHVEGWSSAGLVVISGADMGLWSEEQRQSLRRWVEIGGQVLLLPGTDPKWLESAGVRLLVDVGRVGADDIDKWPSTWFGRSGPRTVLSFTNDGEPLFPAGGNSVKVWRVGAGRVAIVAFDTGVPALAQVPGGLERFAGDLLYMLPAAASPWRDYSGIGGSYEWAPFTDALGNDLVTYPATTWILLVLFAYILIVGPLNFWLLRRRHSPAWAVITVPATGIFVTVLLLTGGFLARDKRILVNRVTVLRPTEDGWVDAREHLVIVAGRRREALLTSAVGRLSDLTDGRRSARREIAYGGATGEEIKRPLEPNEPAYFYAIGQRKMGALSASIDRENLVVVNNTGSDIAQAWFYDKGGDPLALGAIPAGGEFRGPSPIPASRTYYGSYDEDPTSLLLRSLNPVFMKPNALVVIAILKTPAAPPVIDGTPREPKRDVTVLIAPVKDGGR